MRKYYVPKEEKSFISVKNINVGEEEKKLLSSW